MKSHDMTDNDDYLLNYINGCRLMENQFSFGFDQTTQI